MIIDLAAISLNFKKQENLGLIHIDYFDKIRNLNNEQIKLLSIVDPYDNTFYNKKQLSQIKSELKILRNSEKFNLKETSILSHAIEVVMADNNYNYLWLIGD